MSWRDRAAKVTHPPAFASFSVDLGPIRITVGGIERDLIGGSFRGISFYVESHSRSGGRRTVDHEFPFAEKPFVDDLGRKQRIWKLDGYVLGTDYDLHLKELIAALEDTPGPGPLIHPYQGDCGPVICRSFDVKETKGEGGYASISMEFAETDADPPMAFVLPALGDLLGGLLGAIALLIVGLAALVLLAAVTFLTLRALVREILAFVDALASLGELFSGDGAAIFAQRLGRMRSRAATYGRRPDEFLTDVGAALDAIEGADPAEVAEGLLAAYATPTGPEPTRGGPHFQLVVGAIKKLLLLRAVGFASQATYPSHARAVAMRDRLSDLLDEQAATADEQVYQAFVQIRAELARQVPPQGAQLPDVVRHQPIETTSSLLLAYQLYGSVDLELDLVARNAIANPALIRADAPLEVLSRAT
jgi:hypothetical protein